MNGRPRSSQRYIKTIWFGRRRQAQPGGAKSLQDRHCNLPPAENDCTDGSWERIARRLQIDSSQCASRYDLPAGSMGLSHRTAQLLILPREGGHLIPKNANCSPPDLSTGDGPFGNDCVRRWLHKPFVCSRSPAQLPTWMLQMKAEDKETVRTTCRP